jgi:hypothetical protein
MLRALMLLTALLPAAAAAAATFVRPIAQAESATAQLWFAAASVAMIIALYAVHRLVSRR